MADPQPQKEDLIERLRRLMFFRVVVVTFLLSIAAFIQIKGTESLTTASLSWVYLIVIVTYLLAFAYLVLLKKIASLTFNVYVQAICDVSLITVLVYVTGGVESIYSVLYPLVIIYSVLFLGKRGGLVIASMSGILYGLLLDLEYYRFIHPLYSASSYYDFSAGYVLSRSFTHIVSFYIVVYLINFAVEQEKKTRSLLEEKESEFYQLDLLYRSIIQSVSAGIMTINLRREIKSFNKAAEEITGLTLANVQGQHIDGVLPGFSRMLTGMEGEEKGGESLDRHEITISGREGQEVILGFSCSPLIDSKDRQIGHIVIFQDLTLHKEMEQVVEQHKRLALIGEMAAGLAHELRNPLASLCGSIQVLQKNLQLDTTNERLMQIVLRGRDQLENLVRNFILLAGPNRMGRETLQIQEIIDDVLESLHYVPDWDESIKVEKATHNGASVYGNRTEVRQMVWNLVLNAVQSMPDGGRLRIETNQVTLDDGGEYVEIRINDTGCGIQDGNSSRIFEPFFTTKDGGAGLGLAIVNRILESHGGKINIESDLKKGTSCVVLLPQEDKGEERTAVQ